MVYDKIATSVPVNRMARLGVTSADVYERDDTPEELRENLVKRVKHLVELCKATTSPTVKQVLGERIFKLQTQLSKMPKPKLERCDLTEFIIELCKEEVSKIRWKQIIEEAERRYKAAGGQYGP
jgi:hypothetical protein